MSVKVYREDTNSMIREMDSVGDAAAWIIRLFTEHNWDAPRAVIMRSLEPDATDEEKAAARRLWPRYSADDYHILDEAGQKHRVQRDGTITTEPAPDLDREVQGEAEGEGAIEDVGDPAGDPSPETGKDVQGDPVQPSERGQRRGQRSSAATVE